MTKEERGKDWEERKRENNIKPQKEWKREMEREGKEWRE